MSDTDEPQTTQAEEQDGQEPTEEAGPEDAEAAPAQVENKLRADADDSAANCEYKLSDEVAEAFPLTTINVAVDPADGTHAAPLQLEGLFLTMAAQGTRIGREVAARIQEDYGDLLFDTAIPRTVRLAEMAIKGRPTVIYDRRSAGSRAYFDLADELVARYCVDQSAGQRGGAVDAQEAPEKGGRAAGLERFAAGGLEKFLAALSGGDDREVEPRTERGFGAPDLGEPPFEAFAGPEMVSLDDLLEEEERRTGKDDDWSDDGWSLDSDRLN